MSNPALLDTIRYVETPEGITLKLRVAGPMARALAWSMDSLIRYGALWGLSMGLVLLGWAGLGVWLITLFLIEWFYPVVFEIYADGATPGKKALGLQVVLANGAPVDWPAALIRNLLRAVDFLPAFYGFGVAALLISRDFQRLGDLAAGTLVIYRDPPVKALALPPGPALPPPLPLSAAEQQWLIDFAERGSALNPERQEELAALLADCTSGLRGVAAVERLRAHARWLVGEHS
ncbi:MAG: RDD family protein [Candidatus Contendobacter sp.]|nr:RDD family protein [Candidatus Contendobacter sp.]MDS4059991.1 RDD family protein [Candidatus Contendobacter sp.]